jgi:hypothetical protein
MMIDVNRLIPMRWLMDRQIGGVSALSNIRQTYTDFGLKSHRLSQHPKDAVTRRML